ncbi:MAG: Gfo/Idh/MocA family oxidoreductase [Roseobacter sp.]|nr:Gfo/Idh/MocA family oxidoreductase [Roseobacter sp.]
MTGPLRVACVGAGYFSRFHLDAWSRIAEAEVVGVADHRFAAAEATGKPAYSNARALIKAQRPDVLDIILPPAGQAVTIRSALDMGVKAIICQKPFCSSLHEAEQVTALAETVGATLVVHENFRFMPWYRFIKQELGKGAVGKLLNITFRLRPGDGQGTYAYLDRQP